MIRSRGSLCRPALVASLLAAVPACNAILGIGDSAIVRPNASKDAGGCKNPRGCGVNHQPSDGGAPRRVMDASEGSVEPGMPDAEGGAGSCEGSRCDASRMPPEGCKAGVKRCNGNRVEQCDEGGREYDLIDVCEGGVCNSKTLACGPCNGQESSCVDEHTLRACSNGGQVAVVTPCESPAPYCSAGTCAECRTAGDCTSPDPCHTVACKSGVCTYTQRKTGEFCSLDGGYCSAEGRCVSCLDATTCTVSGECYLPMCTSAGSCGETPKKSGETCGGGQKQCDGHGACVECLQSTDCSSNQVCRSNQCTNAVEDVGVTTLPSGSSGVLANWLYLFRLPPLKHDTILQSFGIVGDSTSASATVAMALYGDEGDGKAPAGVAIAQTDAPIGVATVPKETAALPSNTMLNSGATYWLGIVSNVATTTPSQTDANTLVLRLALAYGSAFPKLGSVSTISESPVDWPIYIKVQDTD